MEILSYLPADGMEVFPIRAPLMSVISHFITPLQGGFFMNYYRRIYGIMGFLATAIKRIASFKENGPMLFLY